MRSLLARLVAAAALSAGLVSCGFFGYSVYPDSLTAVDRSADLSDEMLTLNTSQSVVDTFTDGTQRYVFVLQNTLTTVHLVLLDGDLNLLYSGDNPGFGRFHVRNVTTGNIVVGNLEFDPNVRPVTFVNNSPNPSIGGNQMGFYDGQYVVLSINNPDLNAQYYPPSAPPWSSGSSASYLMSNYYNNYDVRRVSLDPATGIVSLVVWGDQGFVLFRILNTDFSGMSTSAGIFDTMPVTIVPGDSGEQMAPVPNGYVVLTTNGPSPELTFHSTDGTNSESALRLYRLNDPRFAAAEDGAYVYVLSTGDKMIYRMRRWW